MNNDRGKAEYVENYTKRQEVYRRLQGLEQERRRVHTPEELEALEREIRGYTDQLGALLVEMHDHCTPALAATVSAWSALLSSFAEVRQVLVEQGVKLDLKGVRRVAYRYAERARVVQQAGQIALAEGDTVQGRRVVGSADGGRLRLRENKRGAKTKKGRTRYRGAWREPKLFIIYVVDARGKLEKSFAPLIDGHLQGPGALFQLLEGYLHSLAIDRADHVLSVADGAYWLWNRIPKLIAALGL